MHAREAAAAAQLLYGFVLLRHSDRRILHIGVTAHPTAGWTIQQIRGAFPFDEAPRYLLHDRDSIYSKEFSKAIKAMCVEEVKTAWRSPWQNPYCERVIGTIRRECLDHIIPLNERHLRRTLRNYQAYYNGSRTHLSLNKNAPNKRPIELPSTGLKIIAIPHLGGLHHRYARKAA